MKPLKISVVGAGYFGRIHARILAAMPEAELVAIADSNLKAAQNAAERYKCKPFSNALSLLNKTDAVIIATPTHTHAQLAIPFLQNGTPVLLEKPLAASAHEAHRIIQTAEKAGTPLLPGHLERFNRGFQKLKTLINDQIYFMDFQRVGRFTQRAAHISVVADLMIHDIDLALSLIPSSPENISAIGAAVFSEHTDMANARISFANGAAVNLVASRLATRTLRRVQTFEAGKHMILDFEKQIIRIHSPAFKKMPPEGENAVNVQHIPLKAKLPLENELAHFVHAVRNGTPLAVKPQDAANAIQIAENIQRDIDKNLKRGSQTPQTPQTL